MLSNVGFHKLRDAQLVQTRQSLIQTLCSLQANSQMEVEMLEQQLHTSKKEISSLKRRLEAAQAALASANISSANPALLRVLKAEGKEGPQRGAGGTPHALALAWAREEAARLSPAVALVLPSAACLLAHEQDLHITASCGIPCVSASELFCNTASGQHA